MLQNFNSIQMIINFQIQKEMLRWQYPILPCIVVCTLMIVLADSQWNPSLPLNCREQVKPDATSPIACARVSRKDLGLQKLELKPEWKTPTAVQTSGGASFNTILNMWVDGSSSADGTVSSADYNKPFDPDTLPGACR